MATFTGTVGNDVLNGTVDDDLFIGGSGNDTIDGGGGVNTASYSGPAARYTVTPDGSGGFYVQDSVSSSGDGVDHLTKIQRLQFTDQAVTPDSIAIGANLSATSTLTTLIGSGGNDTLNGGPAADTLIGGGGNDAYYVNNATDTVIELVGGGTDVVYVSAPGWTVTAGSEIEKVVASGTAAVNLTGNGLAVELDGNSGINTIDDGGGAALMVGGAGNDTYVVRNGATIVVERSGEGSDTVKTTLGSYTLTANVENLTYIGTGNFTGVGNGLANVITGGTGNDMLVGGGGVSRLVGGAGNDTYVVDNASQTAVELAGGGYDTELTTLASLKAAANVEALTYTGSSAFSGYANDTGTYVTGGSGNDTLTNGAGADTFDGGTGTNTVVYQSTRTNYAVYADSGSGYWVRDNQSGVFDRLLNIQSIRFSDKTSAPNALVAGVVFKGTVGPDVMTGGTGSDLFYAGGGDTINGVSGTDTVVYSGSLSQYAFYGDVAGGYYVKTLANGVVPAKFDYLVNITNVQFSDQTVQPGAQVVGLFLPGTSGANTLTGGIGNDIFVGTGGDTIDGAAGTNTVVYSGPSSGYVVYSDGAGGYYVKNNSAGNSIALLDHLTNIQTLQFADQSASASALVTGQFIQGNGNGQSLVGGAGNDLIFGGVGDNSIDGGGGTNTAVYSGPASRYTVYSDGGAGWFIQDNQSNEGNDHLFNVQFLQFSDGVTTPNALAPPFNGASIFGTTQADTLSGSALNDYFTGYGGGDTIDGIGGLDTVVYSGDRGAYTVRGDGSGGYYVQTNASGNSIALFDHLKNISLLEFHDGVTSVASQSAGLLLMGTPGADTLTGGVGADLFVGSGGGDRIDGNAGVNTAIYQGAAARYTVYDDNVGGYYVRSNAAGASLLLFDHLSNIQWLQFDDGTSAPSALATGLLLYGTSSADQIGGGAGNDLIAGGGGGDVIDGGAGLNTVVLAGLFSQNVVLGDGVGNYYVRNNALTPNGLVFDKLSNIQTLQFDDLSVATASASQGLLIIDSAAADTLTGGSGNDLIVGGAGDDVIDGAAGYNIVAYSGVRGQYNVYQDGSGGWYVASRASSASDGLDHLTNISAIQFSDQTVAPANVAIGSAYVGSAAPDTITAGSGNDLLIGGEGGDLLDGGAGADTAVYAGNLMQYQVTPDGTGGFFVTNLSTPATPDHLLNIENLRFGTQTVTPGSVATGAVLTAAPGGSTVRGSGGNDTLLGGGSDDTLVGGAGQDNLDGGAGVNTAVYSGAASRYKVTPDGFGGFYVVDSLGASGDGTDHINNIQYLNFLDQTGAPSQFAVGVILTGVSGQASLIGSSGADTLNAGPDAQTLIGGAGNDTYYVNRSDDVVVESVGGGTDTVNVSATSWTATAGSEIERIIAAAGTAAINLTGNGFAMEIDGNAGANVLDDGGAADVLIGFGGNDTYVVRNVGTTIVEATNGGADTIKTTLNYYALPTNVENLTFLGSGSFYGVGNAGSNVLTGTTGVGTLDGGGGNDTFFVFNTNTTLLSSGGNQTVVTTTNFVLPTGFNTLKMFGNGPGGAALTGVANDAGDILIGDSNKQILVGGAGNDTFTGGGGSDVFSIAGPHSGNDVITDFITGVGGSIVRLSSDGFSQFSQIQANLSQVGADTVLTLSSTDSITFKNAQVGSFSASNFLLPLDTSNMTMSFDDEFSGLSLSNGVSGTWTTTYGFVGATPLSSRTLQATGELQFYVDSNFAGTGSTPLGLNPFSLNNDVLSITATVAPTDLQSQLYGRQYVSGLLTTQNSFSQTYGYFEMRAELPSAAGAWPAFWLLPAGGTNPPELDILETSGMNPSTILTTAHDYGLPGSFSATTSFVSGATTSFHTYGLLWAPDYITWYIDGSQVYRIATPADMNQPMYMLLNLAVGGIGGTPDAQALALSPLQIDYVHAYALNGVTVYDNPAGIAIVSDGRTIPATSPNNDTIVGGSGFTDAFGRNSELNGRNGYDTVAYSGPASQYHVYSDGHGGYFVTDNTISLLQGGADHLVNIEAIQFSDLITSPASIASGFYLQGTPSIDVLTGSAGDDIIFGYSGADTINGGNGNDIIIGGDGTDQIDGGAGINTAFYFGLHNQYAVFKNFPLDGSYSVVDRYGSGGNDHLVNIQYLQFQDGLLPIDVAVASVVYTDPGINSILQFGIGWDVVTGGVNATMDGGDGVDTAVYVGPQSRYSVYSDGSGGYWVEDSVTDSNGIGRQHLLNFEKAQFSDGIVYVAGLATSALLVGGAGADVLTATMDSNFFIGGGGNDTFDGATATSAVVRYSGPASQYNVFDDGTGGYYVVDPTFGSTGTGIDHLIGNITGLGFSDQTIAPSAIVTGGAIVGTTGADTLRGHAGNDLFIGFGGGDSINGHGGFNTVEYSGPASQYLIYKDSAGGYDVTNLATPETAMDRLLNINLISFNEVAVDPSVVTALLLRGTTGADTLTGGVGNDLIFGRGGGDTIDGGGGVDMVRYSGPVSQYVIYKDSAGGYDVENTAAPGTALDRLFNISQIGFSDQMVDPSTSTIQLVRGTPGADTLTGGAGNDRIIGGGGGDTIDGGGGVNTVVYSGAASQYVIYKDSAGGYDVANTATPGQAMDRLFNINTISFSDQSVDPSSATTQLIRGTAGAETLTGGAGNDVIIGGGGGDTIDGGGGINKVIYAGASSQYFVYKDSSGGYDVSNTAVPGQPMDRLFNINAIAFSDQTIDPSTATALLVRGTAGAETLTGGAGNDLFMGGGGSDVINGLGGANTASYSGKLADYSVFADGTGGAWVQTNSAGSTVALFDHLLSVQSLQFSDGVFATSAVTTGQLFKAGTGTLTVTGTAGNDVMVSGGGVDTLIGGAGNDVYYIDNNQDVVRESSSGGYDTVYSSAPWVVTAGSAIEKVVLTGTASLNLTGNALAMELDGNAGINTLSDGGGADLLKGGLGNDTYVVTNAGTIVVENVNEGSDMVRTTLNSYVLPDNVENLTFTGTGNFYGVGNATTGTITGGVGNDTLVSGTGVERLVGGGGNDTFYVNNAADTVVATAGGNSVIYTSVSGILAAANISSVIYTGTGNFTGFANAGGTTLVGGIGNDNLTGAAGNDVLDGGAGNNTLTGGAGADVFRFAAPGQGINRITDFVSGTDQIKLSAGGFNFGSSTDFTFVANATPVATDNHPSVLYNTSTGNLYFDPTGADNHDMVQIAVLSNHPLLTAHDFIIA